MKGQRVVLINRVTLNMAYRNFSVTLIKLNKFLSTLHMRALKVHYFLFLAVFMLAAKPFVGFSAVKLIGKGKIPGVFVKAFTKRKQEYVEDSTFDISAIQKRLANPLLASTVLFSFLLNFIFPPIFRKDREITAGVLSDIHLSLFPPQHRYLLSGKLII